MLTVFLWLLVRDARASDPAVMDYPMDPESMLKAMAEGANSMEMDPAAAEELVKHVHRQARESWEAEEIVHAPREKQEQSKQFVQAAKDDKIELMGFYLENQS